MVNVYCASSKLTRIHPSQQLPQSQTRRLQLMGFEGWIFFCYTFDTTVSVIVSA
jgi:hypothetical protein